MSYYYPLSQIKTNLFTTNDKEFIIKSTGNFYAGKYWSTSDGKFFTGEGPQDNTSLELIISNETNYTLEPNIFSNEVQIVYYDYFYNLPPSTNIVPEYLKLKNIDTNNLPKQKYPTNYNPQPTPDDYKLGEFTRYFCKKTNEISYIEINKDTYDSLSQNDSSYVWEVFIPIKYQWVISGDKKEVFKTNKNVTKYMMDTFKLPFLNKFLNENYLRFWKSN